MNKGLEEVVIEVLRGDVVDGDAIKIGELYHKAKGSAVASVKILHECGARLTAKKESVAHGEWLPWLKENVEVLGFENITSTPQRLMKLSDSALAQNLDEAEAVQISRKIWGHAPKTITSQPPMPVIAPDGKFGCMVVDPPWDMQKIEREVRPNQVGFDYPTMSEAELTEFGEALNGMAAKDCHLFVWTTQKFLPMGLRLLEQWGFAYVFTMVWHKPGGFQPHGLPQYNCEFVLYARRGTPKFVDTTAFDVCFGAPRREHSRKPDEFYDLVSRVTGTSCVDVFSREARDGWAQYGNEIGKFDGELRG